MKKFLGLITFLFALNLGSAQTRQSIQTGTILHCWCWSFNTIKQNMQKISDAGFTAIQTSPINECTVGDYGDLNYMSTDTTGKWFYHYQPTDWKIGNYQLGTRDEFISMCQEAHKYGIGVIVDVVPNHVTGRINFKTKQLEISPDFVQAVGGYDKLLHKNGLKYMDFNIRNQITNYMMGGLPDVNTENPLFQKYFMTYMNDCIDCGADGFRFDTAKHIALPDDWREDQTLPNNFWPIFTGKEPIDGIYLKKADELFIYGEVIQAIESREDAYAEFINLTASAYGNLLRVRLRDNKLNGPQFKNFKHPASGDKLVTWVESHDTYANKGESAQMTNFQLRTGYAIIAGRQQGTPLFFNRPQGPEGVQFPGVSKIGDIGNNEFIHPEVVAINKFRTAMINEPEDFSNGSSDEILVISRGNKGIIIVNSSSKTEKLSLSVSIPDGTYTNHSNEKTFTVQNGILTGKLKKQTIAVIY